MESICDFAIPARIVVAPPSPPSRAKRLEFGAAIRAIVAAQRASNARVFGSVLHGSDRDESDLDILVDPAPDATLFDIGAIRHELRLLLGVTVEVLTPNALPDGFHEAVLAEAKPL